MRPRATLPDDASAYIPPKANLQQLGEAVQHCKGCDLYRHATQAVPGEGRPQARVAMVGEQPGDKEDVAGWPFVGPAGHLLDRALEEAEIARADVYVTNAVKHFKFEEHGKRRIHKKPSDSEVAACKPWLNAELACVQPEIIVCLGATAARALMGKEHRVSQERGRFFPHPLAASITATIHPSAVLRAPDTERRHQEFEALVNDLKGVRKKLDELAGSRRGVRSRGGTQRALTGT